MRVMYSKDEMKSICKDLLYEVNDLRQYVDVIVDPGSIDTPTQLNAVNGAANNCVEIDRILYLMKVMLNNKGDNDANRYADNNNTNITSGNTGDNN